MGFFHWKTKARNVTKESTCYISNTVLYFQRAICKAIQKILAVDGIINVKFKMGIQKYDYRNEVLHITTK